MSSGNNNVICDRTGYKVQAKYCKKTWDGLFVIANPKYWEPKHPQLEIPNVKDDITVAIARPEGQDVFIDAVDINV